ncbi:kinase-like domain-containing protein [Rhizophagus clarus]|uniref:Kinase-like domain-containing protein n=1 Tax=Rhizophagus clarus TaxID=94130 RepID=A0A8H3R0K9_9GLOM|nr:kinase-like domain-containing protein [Rhizophagus clarus]
MNKNFGHCKECKEKNTGLKWCRSCNAKRLEAEFPNWTSGNEELDIFLRETQLTARCWQEVFEWIPYTNIIDVEEVGRGGYGIVYKSKWEGGCIISDFMHELKMLHQFMKFNPTGFECYGVTQDPYTHKYFIVTDYYGKDLHSGNVLVDTITCIADLGQSQDVRTLQTPTEVNGVMPYVAPEVLRTRPYTKAADIYSFGMIMWEFTSFQLPFSERPHNIDLAFNICDGLRPKPIEGTPPCYVELMQKCWNSDPNERPKAEYLVNILQDWFEGSDENISNQFKAADEFNSVNPVRDKSQPVHKSAIYTSRLLPTIPIVNDYSTRQFDFTIPDDI